MAAAGYLLHLLEGDDLMRVLRELVRVLAPGGRLVTVTPAIPPATPASACSRRRAEAFREVSEGASMSSVPGRMPASPPAGILLDPTAPAALERYLRDRDWLAAGERVTGVARAGEGNMNLTLRVSTSDGTVIVKQGRPWVERYPSIPAPVERTSVEADWYALAGGVPALARRMPRLLGVDREARVILLSDVGQASDMLDLYRGERLSDGQLDGLVDWLLELHGGFAGDPRAARLQNRAMRELNHEHIFELPLRASNALDLDAITPGLAAVAAGLRTDRPLVGAAARLGRCYLGEGSALLHGDFYPGSWLRAPEPWVIDPEFGFYGPPEFDLGVMLAHIELADTPRGLQRRALERYRDGAKIDDRLVWGFAGIEVIRRLLGVAQLPLALDLAGKRELIDRAGQHVRASA